MEATSRLVRTTARAAAVTLALVALDTATAPARAQGKLDARYTVSLGGVPIGRGSWVIDVADDQFTAAASGATTGLLRIFASGQGTSASRGTVNGGQLLPTTYASSITTDKKYDEVRMVLQGGNVKDYAVDPPQLPTPDRVPLTDAHRRGVTDPMTASIIRAPSNGDTFVPEVCQHTLAIFDGRMRYDLQLAFKRLERVKADKGYQGTAVVCAVHFAPIAGYVRDRAAIKYLVELRDTEMWLAPIAGTRLMAPYRVTLSTPIGLGVLQATQFMTMPIAAKPTSAARTQ